MEIKNSQKKSKVLEAIQALYQVYEIDIFYTFPCNFLKYIFSEKKLKCIYSLLEGQTLKPKMNGAQFKFS